MVPAPLPGTRSPLVVLAAILVGAGLAKGLVRLAAFGVLLAIVAATVGALTVGVALLRVVVLH